MSKVSAEVLAAVRRAIAKLPRADIERMEKAGIAIKLDPRASLQSTANGDVLGLTRLKSSASGKRSVGGIVVSTGRPHEIETTVQHEIGHAIAWLRKGDKSETAADQYAARY